jgi:hypothetical protein
MDDERPLAGRDVLDGLDDRQIQSGHLAGQPRREVQDLRPNTGVCKAGCDSDADRQPVRIPVAVFIRNDASRPEEIGKSQPMYVPITHHVIAPQRSM